MIPDKNQPEWRDLLTGKKNYKFRNFVLQMKVNQLTKDVEEQKYSTQEAIDQLYELCCKYQLAVKNDIEMVFNQSAN